MPPVRLFALATALILACPPALLAASVSATGSPVPTAPPPLGLGDWVVSGAEVLEDRTIVLDGCLTVEDGGELTISNSTLIVKCAFSEEHWIRVETGGLLRVVNGSTVAGLDPDYPFIFWVEPGAKIEFRDSSFVSAGEQVRYLLRPNIPGSPPNPDYDTVIGGVVIATALADIQNCVFTGKPIALTLLKTEGTLRNCTFRDNRVGVLSHNANWTFEDCTFERNAMGEVLYTKIGAGAWGWRSRSVFRGCSFSEGYTGIAVDNSTCTATGCSFARNEVGGVYPCGFMSYQDLETMGPCGPSVTTVEDCEFTQNVFGIARGIEGWLGPQELHVVNGVFRDNEVYGIWWENRLDPNAHYDSLWPWDGKPRTTWNVTKNSEVFGDLMIFNGSIDVDSGGSLALCRTVLRMDCGSPGENGIQVRSGGRLAITNGSALVASGPIWTYRFACRPGSALVLDGSLLRDCGWNESDPETSGPFIETGDIVIRGSVVESCPVALVMSGAQNVRVEGSRLSGGYVAVRLDNSTLELANSTAGSVWTSSAVLLNGSRLVCLNSSLDRDLLDLQDQSSRVEVGWYLDVLALWSDGRPAAGAGLLIYDAAGNVVYDVSVDAAGRARGLVLWETFITAGGSTVFTPHRLECRSGAVTNTTSLTADRSRSVTVVLPDSEPPSVTISAPAPGALLNSGRVEVAGSARDNLALESVELTVDGFERHTLHRDPEGGLLRLDWNLTLLLPEGAHNVEVSAADTSGNLVLESVSFSIDFTPPRIVILFPREGTLTNLSDIAVSGIVEPGCEVLVNGVEARTLGSTFYASARLSEGDNLIAATAVDAAGNMNASSTIVRLDTLPPRLDVSFVPDAEYVNRAQVNLSGTMEFGAAVWVSGRLVVLPGASDNFTTTVFLARGSNTVSICATDAAGNLRVEEKRFVFDNLPPSFTVLFPPEGYETNEPFLALSLAAEAGSNLSAGDVMATVPGISGEMTNLTLNRTLVEGQNTIVIRAVDLAGNIYAVSRQVLLDTQAPALAVSSPEDGYHTSNFSVYVIGKTDRGAAVSVNGETVAVGQEGDFSLELVLRPGQNRITVASADALGNVITQTLNVTRVAGQAAEELNIGPGIDWPFLGFLVAAVAASVLEGFWLAGRPRRPAPRAGPALGGG